MFVKCWDTDFKRNIFITVVQWYKICSYNENRFHNSINIRSGIYILNSPLANVLSRIHIINASNQGNMSLTHRRVASANTFTLLNISDHADSPEPSLLARVRLLGCLYED